MTEEEQDENLYTEEELEEQQQEQHENSYTEEEQEEQYENSNVTVSYNVGPGHELYDPDSADDIAWEELRRIRLRRLKKVDKYQGILLYNSLTTRRQNQMAKYRQALLDLPSEYDDPKDALDNLPNEPTWMK